MKTHVEFQATAFPPYDGEEETINPGRYGKRLAEFLVRGLTQQGFQPGEPIAEDWGWIVPIRNDEFPMWIGCGSYEEYPNGFLCYIEPHKPTIRPFPFLKKIDTTARVAALQQALDNVLSTESSIINKKWWTLDEFQLPKSDVTPDA